MSLEIVPVSFRQAQAFIAKHHRHHKPPTGHKFSLGIADGRRVPLWTSNRQEEET